MRLLIVEDSPLVQSMYGLAFPRREHELTTANDGREALARLDDPTNTFDVILLDLRMPGMDGVGFLREVRRQARLAQLPIVLTTIEPDGSELLEEAKRLGVTAVVKKPWHPQQLRSSEKHQDMAANRLPGRSPRGGRLIVSCDVGPGTSQGVNRDETGAAPPTGRSAA